MRIIENTPSTIKSRWRNVCSGPEGVDDARRSVLSAVNCLLRRIFVPAAICSSLMCIFVSLRSTKTEFPVWFRSFVRILPNVLNKRSQDAELAETDSKRRANIMKGDVSSGCPGIEKESKTESGLGCRFYSRIALVHRLEISLTKMK